MGCVRKRGKSWNAQVRIAGWRSFTKSFKSKSDAVCWVQQTEHQLKNTSLPLVDVGDTTLRELLQTYAKEVSSHLERFRDRNIQTEPLFQTSDCREQTR